MAYVEFLSSVSMALIGDTNLRKRRGRSIHFSAQKQRQTQLTFNKNPLSTRLSTHMPVVGTKGRCGYCSTKVRPIYSNIKCSFCSISLCVKKNKNCFSLFHENVL